MRITRLLQITEIRMNRTGTMLTLLATAILMAVAACTRQETYNSTIMRAESMTDTNPHGALTLLDGRKDSLCTSPGDSALYELVYTEAVHDLGVTLANSEYINRSAEHFLLCGDRRRRARALVQTALCRYDNRDLQGAMLLAKMAEEVAARLRRHGLWAGAVQVTIRDTDLHTIKPLDKDAVVASMLCAEMVCYYTYKGTTVFDRLNDIYKKYGYVLDCNVSIQYKGLNAMKEMNAVVDGLKETKINKLDIYEIAAIRDYSKDEKLDLATGEVSPIGSPKTNCVYYELKTGSFVCVRPSGTEPKLKIYYSVKANNRDDAEAALKKLQAAMEALLKKAAK